jgi:hypothetical protein
MVVHTLIKNWLLWPVIAGLYLAVALKRCLIIQSGSGFRIRTLDDIVRFFALMIIV